MLQKLMNPDHSHSCYFFSNQITFGSPLWHTWQGKKEAYSCTARDNVYFYVFILKKLKTWQLWAVKHELLFYSFTVTGATVHLVAAQLYLHAYSRSVVLKRMWRNHLLCPFPKDRMKHVYTIPNVYYLFNQCLRMFGDGSSSKSEDNSLQCFTLLSVKNYFKGKFGIMLSKLHGYWAGWMKYFSAY